MVGSLYTMDIYPLEGIRETQGKGTSSLFIIDIARKNGAMCLTMWSIRAYMVCTGGYLSIQTR